MRLRATVFMCTCLAVLLTVVSPALGWANGGGDGYGTHDWILDHAIAAAADSGADVSWIDMDAALHATDDPDFIDLNSNHHLFREIGIGRGAPQCAADQYSLAIDAYRQGDYGTASVALGRLAHYYGDITQPFHTDYEALKYQAGNDFHAAYELAVDRYTREFDDEPAWSAPLPAAPIVKDVRSGAVAAAYYSRTCWPALRSALATQGLLGVDVNDSVVASITGAVLRRACSDLAQVVSSVDKASLVSLPPATLTTWMSRSYPAISTTICAYARARDASGHAMEGVGVTFVWPLASGEKTVIAYTDANGLAHYWQNIGSAPAMQRAVVLASAFSGESSRTGATWYMRTPHLGSGGKGFRVSLSSTKPKRGTVLTVTVKAFDTAGKPVAGLPVKLTMRFKTTTSTFTAVTGADGAAVITRNVGKATRGYKVSVKATTTAAGHTRTATSAFTPS